MKLIKDLLTINPQIAENTDYDDEEESSTGSADQFYVAVYDDSEDSGWIGLLSKEGGKWKESTVKGEPPYAWGTTYMSYLTPNDVMQWITKDYKNHDVEGPFDTVEEAEEWLDNNYGIRLSEAKAPRKGSLRADMAAQSKKYWDAQPEIRIKDNMVGNARITSNHFQDGKEAAHAKKTPKDNPHKQFSAAWEQWDDGFQSVSDSQAKQFDEAFKLNDKVTMIGGPKDVRGKTGHIGEIRTALGGAKSYTVDYEVDGRTTSVRLTAAQMRALKE